MNQKPHHMYLSLLEVKGFGVTFFTSLLVLSLNAQYLGHSLVAHQVHG